MPHRIASIETVISENEDLREFFSCTSPSILTEKVKTLESSYSQVILDEHDWAIGIQGITPLFLAVQRPSETHIFYCMEEFKKHWLKAIRDGNQQQISFFEEQSEEMLKFPSVSQDLLSFVATCSKAPHQSSISQINIENLYNSNPKLEVFFSQPPNKDHLEELKSTYLISWHDTNNTCHFERLNLFSLSLLLGKLQHALFLAKHHTEANKNFNKYIATLNLTSEQEAIKILNEIRARTFGLTLSAPSPNKSQSRFFDIKSNKPPQTLSSEHGVNPRSP